MNSTSCTRFKAHFQWTLPHSFKNNSISSYALDIVVSLSLHSPSDLSTTSVRVGIRDEQETRLATSPTSKHSPQLDLFISTIGTRFLPSLLIINWILVLNVTRLSNSSSHKVLCVHVYTFFCTYILAHWFEDVLLDSPLVLYLEHFWFFK